MEHEGIGALLRRRREELGLTQTEVAERADFHRARLAQLEKGGTHLPGVDVRRRLGAVLGLRNVDFLIAAGELSPDELAEPLRQPHDPLVELVMRLPQDERAALFPVVHVLLRDRPALSFPPSPETLVAEEQQT